MRQLPILTCLAAALLTMGANAFAYQQNLGTLDAKGTEFGHSFYESAPNFTDYYTFSIAGNGSVSGSTSDASFRYGKDVVLTSLILGNNSFSNYFGVDLSIPNNGETNTFTFEGLTAGTYKLAVTGYVNNGRGEDNGRGEENGRGENKGRGQEASYSGVIRTSASVASPAPEPADLALTVMGLAGVGLMLRRARA